MSTRRWFALGTALFLAAGSVGCGGEVKTVTAATQLLVSVDIDPALLAQVDRLRATVWSRTGSTWKEGTSVTLIVAGLSLPVDLPLVPGRPADESATVEVVLQAVAGAQVVAETRVLSSFVPNTHRQIGARLALCAGQPAGFVCSTADCHGDACKNCSSTGACVPVMAMAGVDMSTVQPVDAGQSGPDAPPSDGGKLADGSAPGDAGGRDAVGPSRDAAATEQTDGGPVLTPPTTSDAGQTDAGPADSGPPAPKLCPADHGCTAPYPCVTTALGYTCLGQFADWPMPDGFPTTKHVQSYTTDGNGVTVVDAVTKLEWETNLPEVHEGCTKYPEFYLGSSELMKGMPGEYCSLPEARKHCADAKTGGKDDWRLPSMIELASLIDHARVDYRQAINADYFPDIVWSGYVTTSIYPVTSPTSYRQIDFVQRFATPSQAGEVRCVRGGTEPPFATPAGHYTIDTVTDTVTDNATGLIWQRKPSPLSYMDDDAAIDTYCQAPFRLPTPNELLTLVDPTREKPSIDPKAFPDTPSVAFFAVDNDRGRAVNFDTGDLGSAPAAGKVRCVR